MKESIVIEIAPVITVMQMGGSLTGGWLAAAAGAEHSMFAPSSALHNLYLKHRQARNRDFGWKHESCMPSVGAM